MKKSILNLEGVQILSRNEQKLILGSKLPGGGGAGTVCKATCGDSSLVTVSTCDTSTANLGCSNAGGSKSCKCDYPGPLDPPGGGN